MKQLTLKDNLIGGNHPINNTFYKYNETKVPYSSVDVWHTKYMKYKNKYLILQQNYFSKFTKK